MNKKENLKCINVCPLAKREGVNTKLFTHPHGHTYDGYLRSLETENGGTTTMLVPSKMRVGIEIEPESTACKTISKCWRASEMDGGWAVCPYAKQQFMAIYFPKENVGGK